MKQKAVLIFMLLLATLNGAARRTLPDSLLMNKIFNYQQQFTEGVEGFTSNVYVKHLYMTRRRNITLWAIPSMFAIARGRRNYVSEQYGRFTFHGVDNYENRKQVYYTTIPYSQSTMNVLMEFLTPDLYNATIYRDHILSPFNRSNRVFYRYSTARLSNGVMRLYYRPRFVTNTQLVKGQALIEESTGRIIQAEMEGEFDMIHFRTLSMQGEHGPRALLPKLNQTFINFHFMGNHITSHFEAVFDCPITLPDSVDVTGDRALIDSVRPISLSAEEQAVYALYDSINAPHPEVVDTTVVDTTQTDDEKPRRRHDYLKEIGWDLIGDNLIHSLRAQSANGYVKLSPILDPQYISYSDHHGFSYKLKLGAQYNFSPSTHLYFNPTAGYVQRPSKFYFDVPLRLTFAPRYNGHLGATWGTGNRIGSSAIFEEIVQEHGEDIKPVIENMELDQFDDIYLTGYAGAQLAPWLAVEAGVVLHNRQAVNADAMRQFGKPVAYNSLAPQLTVKIRPWPHAPLLTIDYERGIKARSTYLDYERIETDLSLKHRMPRMQTLNVRVGSGHYIRKEKSYFMDFAHFRDQKLSEGWDDDWTGNFQLLSSELYNSSKYYVRGNISYESPLLLASLTPLVGRYVERERAYISLLGIAHTRLYSELGYGFTCRYFSTGLFASFLGAKFNEVGCQFTFELFRRW